MAFVIPKQPYSGKIMEIRIGEGKGVVTIGGEDAFPFHLFEGKMPNPPKIAMEVWDYDPSEEWPAAAVAPFRDVISSPVEWAKKCVKEYGADMIVLQLKSTDPNGMNRGSAEAAEITKKVSEAIDVPLIVWGTANNQKDEEVLKRIAETCQDRNITLAPVEEGNHKGVGAAALGYGHNIVASSPIDVNLAKQLNILLSNLGVKKETTLIDPTTGGLGYGLEYSYSVMERIRMAALTQEDEKLQSPMINNIGNEVWKCKEAGLGMDEAPTMGDPEKRGILMEASAAISYLMGGSDIVVLRHPESVRLTRAFIQFMINGGMASEVPAIAKRLETAEADLLSISPKPDLDLGGKEKPKEKPTEPAVGKPEEAARMKAEEEAKVKARVQEDAKKKAEEGAARKKAEEEAIEKAKVEADVVKRAAEERKRRAEEEAKAKEKAELQTAISKRVQAREKHAAEKASHKNGLTKKPAGEQLDLVDKLTRKIDRIHKRDIQTKNQ